MERLPEVRVHLCILTPGGDALAQQIPLAFPERVCSPAVGRVRFLPFGAALPRVCVETAVPACCVDALLQLSALATGLTLQEFEFETLL